MSDVRLIPEVRDILERSVIEGNILTLPPGQLERKLYEAVNKVLVNCGGKWNRGKAGHVFSSDPRELLGLSLSNGVAIDQKKKFQSFYTPAALAEELVIQVGVEGLRVLEPSAGGGAIVEACLKFGATQVDCVELREECREKLIGRGRAVTIGDFLALEVYQQFDRIIMNPPFAKNQDVKHVEHALKFLKPGGKLIAVMSPNQDRPGFKRLLDRGASVRQLPRDTFKESGTAIAAAVLDIELEGAPVAASLRRPARHQQEELFLGLEAS